jgi:hypothetical protein
VFTTYRNFFDAVLSQSGKNETSEVGVESQRHKRLRELEDCILRQRDYVSFMPNHQDKSEDRIRWSVVTQTANVSSREVREHIDEAATKPLKEKNPAAEREREDYCLWRSENSRNPLQCFPQKSV